MHPAAQSTHRTRTAQLAARITVLETVVDDLAAYLSKWAPAIGGSLEQHAGLLETHAADVHQLQTINRTTAAPDRLMSLELFRTCNTVLGRLRWLVTGR